MTNELKQQIVTRLKEHMQATGLSGGKLSRRLKNISHPTLSHILNNKWADGSYPVSEEMWNVLANYLKIGNDWNVVTDIQNYKRVIRIAKDCQAMSISRAIAAAPGTGKSTALQAYAQTGINTYYVECKEHWNRKVFLNKIRQAMAMSIGNESVSEIVEIITEQIKRTGKPLIILDEADKLKDTVINFFVSLYNDTHKECGYVLSGSIFFKNNVEKNVRKNKLGYAEFYSRMGREFIALRDITPEDVRGIAEANGIEEDDEFIRECISEIVNNRHNDLRRLERMIINYKKSRKK